MNQPKQTTDSSIRITMTQGGYRYYQQKAAAAGLSVEKLLRKQLQIPRRTSLMIVAGDDFVEGVVSL